ncbi:MAG: cupin domain-containing protein [Geodermatophilaceae bacterium]
MHTTPPIPASGAPDADEQGPLDQARLTVLLETAAGAPERVDGEFLDTPFENLGYDSIALLETASLIQARWELALPASVVMESRTPRALLAAVNAAPRPGPTPPHRQGGEIAAGHTDNSIVIAAPLDMVWDMTNDVESWPQLFSEYQDARVLEQIGDTLRIRLTLNPDPDGRTWSWVSDRTPDRATRTVRSHRVEKGPFEYMELAWSYHQVADGTRMRWVQDFAMRADAPFTNKAMTERLNHNTRIQMQVIRDNIERAAARTDTFRPAPAEPVGPLPAPAGFRPVAVDSVTPLLDRGGDLRIVLSPRNADATGGIMVVADIAPRRAIREHYHPYSEERVLVLDGEMLLTLGEDSYVVKSGHAFVIPAGVPHRMGCDGDTAVRAVLCLGPLAPQPELGHVDTE